VARDFWFQGRALKKECSEEAWKPGKEKRQSPSSHGFLGSLAELFAGGLALNGLDLLDLPVLEVDHAHCSPRAQRSET